MRPTGDTHQALMKAAEAIRTERAESGAGATLMELVHRSQVGYKAARAMVAKMKERGHLVQVGERRVDYRNRPVAEYAPAPERNEIECRFGEGWIALDRCVGGWAR